MSLRHTILGFLSIRPMSGYRLKRYFEASVRHFWTADQAAIYRALAELTSEQLVEHERVAQTPYCYALSVGGGDGVARLIENLRTELKLAMKLCGRPSLAEIDRSVLWK